MTTSVNRMRGKRIVVASLERYSNINRIQMLYLKRALQSNRIEEEENERTKKNNAITYIVHLKIYTTTWPNSLFSYTSSNSKSLLSLSICQIPKHFIARFLVHDRNHFNQLCVVFHVYSFYISTLSLLLSNQKSLETLSK